MTLPQVTLDDRRFQDLVNECRTLVPKKCPEWTEANVSDPGITLIELFAWMTDMLSYRINRLPEKAHVALMELLGVYLRPPRAATARLHFELEHPPARPVRIPALKTEAATVRTQTREPLVFRTSEEFVIQPQRLKAYLLKGEGRSIEVPVDDGVASPSEAARFAFSEKPKVGDQVLLGFERPLDRLLVRVEVQCKPAGGAGIDPHEPPLAWTASTPEGKWESVATLRDTTSGFNKSGGEIRLEMPTRTARHRIDSYHLYWVCCQIDPNASENDLNKIYTSSPEIFRVSAEPIGASVAAQHCQAVSSEHLGRSDGTPGQSFKLHFSPVLPLDSSERLQVYDQRAKRWMDWTRVDTFAKSKPADPHYMLDESSGEVAFGPTIRQPDGSFVNYGMAPPAGSELRFSAYRHGGGSEGNVAAKTITRLRQPIEGVRSVVNPQAASGGMDGESLQNARARVAIEQRTRERAITSVDFEELCVSSSERVMRACCLPDPDGGPPRLFVVPKVDRPARGMTAAELKPKDDVIAEVTRHLEKRRLVGTSVAVKPALYRAVSVVVEAVAETSADVGELRRRILRALYTYLNPLIGGAARGPGSGWQFGRALRRGELYPIVEAIDGIAQLEFVRVYEANLDSGEILGERPSGDLSLAPEELIASGTHRVRVKSSTPL